MATVRAVRCGEPCDDEPGDLSQPAIPIASTPISVPRATMHGLYAVVFAASCSGEGGTGQDEDEDHDEDEDEDDEDEDEDAEAKDRRSAARA